MWLFWVVSSDSPRYFVALSARKLLGYLKSKRVMLLKMITVTTVVIPANVVRA